MITPVDMQTTYGPGSLTTNSPPPNKILKKGVKVGKCRHCGHWGLLRGDFCKDKTRECRKRFNEWLYQPNVIIKPLKKHSNKVNLGPKKPDIFRLLIYGPVEWNYGTMTKRFIHK